MLRRLPEEFHSGLLKITLKLSPGIEYQATREYRRDDAQGD